jgi:hypothetical protein
MLHARVSKEEVTAPSGRAFGAPKPRRQMPKSTSESSGDLGSPDFFASAVLLAPSDAFFAERAAGFAREALALPFDMMSAKALLVSASLADLALARRPFSFLDVARGAGS